MKPTDAHIASALRTDLHAYRAYGLTVGCDFEAPELTPVESEALDVRVVRARLPRPIPDVAEGIVFDFSDPAGLYFGWPLLGHFLLLEDGLILYDAAPGAEDKLSFALLGPVFSVVLHRAGRLLLHSSAVSRGEEVVFFLGDKGAGKSTSAAALVGAGFDLVTDDLLALKTEPAGVPTVEPGFPQLKLSVDAADLLGDTRRAELAPLNEKSRIRLLQGFSRGPRRITGGYVLARGEALSLRRLDSVAALSAVMRYSYITRFGRRLLDKDGLARHLRQCASVVNSTPIYELTVPADLARLPDLVQHALDHAPA